MTLAKLYSSFFLHHSFSAAFCTTPSPVIFISKRVVSVPIGGTVTLSAIVETVPEGHPVCQLSVKYYENRELTMVLHFYKEILIYLWSILRTGNNTVAKHFLFYPLFMGLKANNSEILAWSMQVLIPIFWWYWKILMLRTWRSMFPNSYKLYRYSCFWWCMYERKIGNIDTDNI